MKTDVDTALTEVANWYIKNRREMTPAELEPILRKHCEGEAEVEKFTKFLLTDPGQLRFKTLLRERKSEPSHLVEKPQHTTTMEERFTIDCSYCGFLTTERTLNDAFLTARRLAQRHNTPEEKITIYDRLAQKGACQVYDIEGNCVGYKPFSEKEKTSTLKETSSNPPTSADNLLWVDVPNEAVRHFDSVSEAGKYIGRYLVKELSGKGYGDIERTWFPEWETPEDLTFSGTVPYGSIYIKVFWGDKDFRHGRSLTSDEQDELTDWIAEAWFHPYNPGPTKPSYLKERTPKAEVAPVELYRTTKGFEEDAALRTDLETKQGYKLYAVFDTPEAMQEAAKQLAGQDIKFVKHISTPETGEHPTWEIYAKIPKAPVTPEVGSEEYVRLFNVYDQNNKLIGQVEGDTLSEARHYAYRFYGSDHFPRRVLDVRPAIPKAPVTPEVTKEPFIYSTGGTNPRYWVKTGEPAHPLHPESFATKAEAEKFLAYIKATGEAIYEAIPKAEPGSPSYLKEALAETETECQIISPQYYDILTWLNVPVPDYSFAIEPEVKERKIDEVLQKLKDGVSRIHESAIFKEFLTTMAKFWDYSIGNQILIMIQKPSATRVAGFNTWKDLGRYVKKGESGIAILAPCLPPKILKCPLCEKTFTERELRTHLAEVHQREDVSILVREAREETAGVPTPTYFKVVYVFDVAQTEGKPLPEVKVPVLTGAYSKDLYDRLMGLATKQGLTVSFEPKPSLSPEIKGSLLEKDIWIKPDESEAQRLKTLAHETAHHFTEHVYFIPRADAEVIAESVAFVVCAHFGFDTGTRSFPYVALWAKERKVLEQNLATIRKISSRMIEELSQ